MDQSGHSLKVSDGGKSRPSLGKGRLFSVGLLNTSAVQFKNYGTCKERGECDP